MIHLDDGTLQDIKRKNGILIIKLSSNSCGWVGGISRSLWIEILNFFPDTQNYILYEYMDAKIFVHRDLKISENALVYKKNYPSLIGSDYLAKGIEIID